MIKPIHRLGCHGAPSQIRKSTPQFLSTLKFKSTWSQAFTAPKFNKDYYSTDWCIQLTFHLYMHLKLTGASAKIWWWLIKKLTVFPLEAEKPAAVDRQNEYLQTISQVPASRLLFFDESSVIKTTGNQRYGSARLGECAIEIQHYASNATYTINLLHSLVGVDCFNVLDGASNGEEFLNFFDDALQVERADRSAALERGDVVVMDNCGCHHAHHVEPLLRQMLADCGIGLLFQPTYSPHFNMCEYCFNQIKEFFRRN